MHGFTVQACYMVLYLLAYTPPVRPTENTTSRCQPDCTNSYREECNEFQIGLRAAVSPCHRPPPVSASTVDEAPSSCVQRLRATVSLVNKGATATYNQYVVIDHVVDPGNGLRASLLNPYVVVLWQKPLLQLYGLQYRYVVNGEAQEEVRTRRNTPGFHGCNEDTLTPCGHVQHIDGQPVPFSQGFCCDCDEEVNRRRQPWAATNNASTDDGQYVGSSEHKVYRVAPRFIANGDFLATSNEHLDAYDDEDEAHSRRKIWKDGARRIQKRGGQVCEDKHSPASSGAHQDSAHCLQYSKLWYSVYQLSEPLLEHTVHMRVYQKREQSDGSACWQDLTAGATLTVGTFHPKDQDQLGAGSVAATYSTGGSIDDETNFALDTNTKRLLVPQQVPQATLDQHPEVLGGPQEYLVVDRAQLKPTGDECDAAGVGYSGFYNQPHRCSSKRGTCLHNQPLHLWQQDKAACNEGSRGQYFLKNYARVPEDALRTAKHGDTKYLALYYGHRHKSSVDLEILANDNVVFRSTPLARITEVYVDATGAGARTGPIATCVTIKLFNYGLVSNTFRPRLADCPLEVPADWANLEGEAAVIPPQRVFTYSLRLLGLLPAEQFYCTVEALNARDEVIAVRRIRVVRGDRCICSWHCVCACHTATGLGCVPLERDEYAAAGFIGSMPLTSSLVKAGHLQHALFDCFFFLALIVSVLLLLGVAKALVGLLCSVPVGIWGLDVLVGTSTSSVYLEQELRHRARVYDADNWPVHPDTFQRTVRLVDVRVELCLNLVFFFTFPVALAMLLCRRVCCPCHLVAEQSSDSDYKFDAISTVVYTQQDSADTRTDDASDADSGDMFDFMDNATSASE